MNSVDVPEARYKVSCPLSSHFIYMIYTATFDTLLPAACSSKLSMYGNLIED